VQSLAKGRVSNGGAKAAAWPVWAILGVTLLAYAPALSGTFLNLDDYCYLTAVRPFTLQKAWYIFTHFFEGYHPLSLLSLGFLFRLAEFNPWPQHALNVALHLANTALVYRLLVRVQSDRRIAWMACAVFGLHPIHVEAVAWITSRKDVLYAFFYLLGLCRYVDYARAGNRRGLATVFVLFVLAVLSKGMAVSFPLAMLAVDYAVARPLAERRVWLEKAPFLATAAFFGWVSIRAQQASGYTPELEGVAGIASRSALALQAVAMYVWHALDLSRITAFHPYPDAGSARFLTWLGAAAVGGLVAAVVLAWRRNRAPGFAALLYASALVLVLQWVPVSAFVVADRYQYVSSVGFCLAAGLLFAGAGRTHWQRAAARAVFALYLLVCGWAVFRYAEAWRNSLTLWTHVLSRYPTAYFPLNMRGLARHENGRSAEALRDFDEAARCHPREARTYLNRGFVRDKLGDVEGALADYETYVSLKPGDPLGYNNRGLLHLRAGRHAPAAEDFSTAIRLAPRHEAAHLFFGNRAEARLAAGDLRGAVEDSSAALARFPRHYRACLTRAEARWRLGQKLAAEADVEQALRIDPHDPAAHALRTRWQNTTGVGT
jgi:tetratricopeptide (TPR) repeat protein